MLLLSRKAVERGIRDSKGRCFEDWHRETEWVRIKVGRASTLSPACAQSAFRPSGRRTQTINQPARSLSVSARARHTASGGL
ncbi:hypothetical protein BV20DRAFT_963051 [Pilatotrama ljubarskyi]|nr:hypothetical protein BV20DRAFT_963051 [Pilatotrama ljubarskyi]